MPVRAHARKAPARRSAARPAFSCLFLALLTAQSASALEIDTGNPDWTLRWDNTVKASLMQRLKDASPTLSAQVPLTVNQDDGDNNFKKGLVSNRLDLLTELDLAGPGYGARISGAAWYDSVYNGRTDNAGFTANHRPGSAFATETRDLMGRKAELLDAFVYGKFDLGERPASARLGRHTLLWGESLFFGANGIAGGQAPLDLIKLLSVPNATFKEVARPTGKLSGQVQLSPDVSLGAYLAYEWEKTRLMPAGAYLSSSDSLGPGAERILAGPGASFERQPDLDAKDSGQGGVQLRFRAPSIDTDFGLYAIRYHATTPSNINTVLTGVPPAVAPSSYRWMYHEGVRAFGASFAKTVGEWGWAGEVSLRQNTPLASSGQSTLSTIGVNAGLNNNSNPGYAVGETAHAQVSWIASLGPSFLARESSFVGEVAWNTRLKVTRNQHMLNPNADKSALATRMVFSPTYRQVLPGLDLSPSIGLGYTKGKSSAVGPGFGVDGGGDISLGLNAVYLGSWNLGVNYVHFLGKAAPTLDANNNAVYQQALKDRNYLTVSLRTTF
ncbi:MAG: hypothetical protein A2W72_23740 [Burkholderiales bacterium RIFCSPLOWO2_12_67_14]|nr:MAG: hypothetical protein A3I64_13450 [Burkholderiales bacterium RIFCSPLOWO2_02_FULL_67_64]OGB41595.1 MAG: hypothetical protein A3E51_02875 [Burkholderiales bacterium RIFCSPHIGHO2_12_FULL_67_38]OGB43498.1 MAG: hypothetical protein A2W72_23740 [Burkholderiales bacterium RIFCSPLOWO2_12_67_14]